MLKPFYTLFLFVLPLLPLLLLLLLPLPGAGSEKTHCSRLSRADIERRLSTKTPYRSVANYDETPPQYPGCHPTRIWSIIRHGTRNPSESVILQAQHRLEEIKKLVLKQSKPNLCAEDLEKLRLWSWKHLNAHEDEKLLVAEGEDELLELAERMQNRFPSLMPDIYSPEWYYFKYTATQRTLKSAQSFATGLFGRHRIHAVKYPPPLHKDPVLRVSGINFKAF